MKEGKNEIENKSHIDGRIEEIALRASDMKLFQDIVEQARNKIDAIREIRRILNQQFPEIKDIPEPESVSNGGLLSDLAPGKEFLIARNIVDILFKK